MPNLHTDTLRTSTFFKFGTFNGPVTIQPPGVLSNLRFWTFLDPLSGLKHQLNTNMDVNNFTTTVVGTLLSHYGGVQMSLNGKKMVSLFVTENLEVTIQPITV